MAQSARQFDDEEIPGNQDSTPPGRAHLRGLEGGGQTTTPNRSWYNEGKRLDSGASGGLRNLSSLQDWAKRRKKAIIASIALALATIISTIVLFLALAPFKILHIVNNLQSHFYSSSENAVQHETDNLFGNYVKKYVLKANCRSTIDKTCNPLPILGTNPVSRLYKSWSQARLEEKLATKYGIEFKFTHGHYYIKAPGLGGADGLNIDDYVKDNQFIGLDDYMEHTTNPDWVKANRSQIRTVYKDAFINETAYKRYMYRFKVGRLLEEKYGIRRCIIFCGITDPLADSIDAQKNAAKLFLVERVVQPRAQNLGIVLQCLFANEECSPQDSKPHTCNPETDCELGGTPENDKVDTAMRNGLADLASRYGAENLEALQELYDQVAKNGARPYLVKYVIEKVFQGAVKDETATKISDAIPIVGWINLAAELEKEAADSGPKIKKLSYVVNAASAVELYTMYRTYADEIKSGHVTAAEVGSFTDSLGPADAKSKATGGTAGAEATPLYDWLMNGKDPTKKVASRSPTLAGSFLDSISPSSKVFAATSSQTAYACNDGNGIKNGGAVCPEEELGRGSDSANEISNFLKSSHINDVAFAWNHTIGLVFKGINILVGGILNPVVSGFTAAADAVCRLPHAAQLLVHGAPEYCAVKDYATQAAGYMMNLVVQYLIPNPISDNMAGGRTFDMMAAGADVSGNDYSHLGLGGGALSDQEVTDIINEQNDFDYQSYKNQSFLARMFDTNSNYSPATKLAMAMPTTKSEAMQSVGSFFSNPFSRVGGAFGSIFSHKAFAASPPINDPFGVTQYGYATDAPIYKEDPEAYWDKNCNDNEIVANGNQVQNWDGQAAGQVDENGMPKNTSEAPCLLVQAALGSSGAQYDASLLTEDDRASSGGGGSGSAPAVSGNAQQLAQQILANKNIQLSGRLVPDDIKAAANNQPGSAGVMTSSAILSLIATIGASHTVEVTAIQSGGSGHCNNTPKSACPNDPHYNGDGVDFSAFDGKALTGRDNGSLSIMQTAFTVLPGGSGFGQSQCGSTPTLPNEDITFQDSCNHLHVQVPKGTP